MTARERNRIWDFFMNPTSRQMLVDWEMHAQAVLGWIRGLCGGYLGDAKLIELVDDLQRESPDFRQWWSQHEVQGKHIGLKVYQHSIVGRLEFGYSLLQVTEAPELTMIVYTPVPETDTIERLQKLDEPTE
jgi:hypothetical protein